VSEQLVRTARIHDGPVPRAADGVTGDPRRASAAAGSAGLDLIVARTRDAIAREVGRR
jgi:creatinine amidohydrolase/Fe(II)-dependent formamide hydrolase-like protein